MSIDCIWAGRLSQRYSLTPLQPHVPVPTPGAKVNISSAEASLGRLPGLTEHEARQIIQKVLGRIPELTIKQILRQTGNSIRRLTELLERLKELQEINGDRGFEELIPAATGATPAFSR